MLIQAGPASRAIGRGSAGDLDRLTLPGLVFLALAFLFRGTSDRGAAAVILADKTFSAVCIDRAGTEVAGQASGVEHIVAGRIRFRAIASDRTGRQVLAVAFEPLVAPHARSTVGVGAARAGFADRAVWWLGFGTDPALGTICVSLAIERMGPRTERAEDKRQGNSDNR